VRVTSRGARTTPRGCRAPVPIMENIRGNTGVTRVLVVEPGDGDAEMIRQAFAAYGPAFALTIVDTMRRARQVISEGVDVVVAAVRLSDGAGVELLAAPKKGQPVFPLIVLADGENVRAAVTVLRAGAMEFQVRTSSAIADLPLTVTRVLSEWRRVQMERENAVLGQRAVAILEMLPDLIGIAEPDGRVVYVNRAGCAMLGADDADQLRGSRMHELFPDWSVAELVSSAARGRVAVEWNDTARICRRGGDEIRARQAVFAHVAPSSEVAYFTIVARAPREMTGGMDTG